jgi:hypothetical protein
VHVLRSADDGIDRTGLQAERAADAGRFVDHRQRARTFAAAGGIEAARLTPGDPRQPLDPFLTPGRAAVDVGAGGDGLA